MSTNSKKYVVTKSNGKTTARPYKGGRIAANAYLATKTSSGQFRRIKSNNLVTA